MSHFDRRHPKSFFAHLWVERLESQEVPAVITVTSLADAAIGSTHTGVTLRDAVQAANTDASVNGSAAGRGADTIVFDPSLMAGGTATVTLTLGTLSLSTDVTIDGGGVIGTEGSGGSSVFRVGSGVTAALRGLTVTHGNSQSRGGVYIGGILASTT